MDRDEFDVMIFLFQLMLSGICIAVGVHLISNGELPIGSIEFWVSTLVNFSLLALCFIKAVHVFDDER